MSQVLSLQVQLHTQTLRQPGGEMHRGGTADVLPEQPVEFTNEGLIRPGRNKLPFQLDECGHQRLGGKAASELTEATGSVGAVQPEPGHGWSLAARTKRLISSGSFTPGDASSLEDASTPYGRTSATALPTLSGPKPPARTKARSLDRRCDHSNTRPVPPWTAAPPFSNAPAESASGSWSVGMWSKLVGPSIDTGRSTSRPCRAAAAATAAARGP